jgi:antitoxin component YwqK of YwqJK toxin-antitoxin module
MKVFFTSLCAVLLAGTSMAQETDLSKLKLQRPITNSDSVISEGIKLHDAKKYDEAIVEFEKINENDSSYVLAQFELANSYVALKKDSMAIKVIDKTLAIDKSYYSKLLLLKADAYDGLKQYSKSEEVYKKGIKEFPYSPRFFHELAISYYNQKRYKEAYDNFINALNVNPQYPPSHFHLGVIALRQKKVIQAMLSFQFYLLLDNSTSRAKTTINLLEQLGDDAVNYDDWQVIEPFDNDDSFSDLEAIVKSKAAFNDKFKSKVKLNFRMLKQMQVVIDKIEYSAADKNFHNQFYAKFFKELSSKDFTETYLYYALSEVEIADVNKWVKSNKSKVDEFRLWFILYMRNNYSEITMPENPGKKAYKVYSYNEIAALGNLNDKNDRIDYWKFFYTSTSAIKSQGNYDSKGQKTGAWKYYYEDGTLKETCNFKEDKLDGEYFKYHPNGKMMNHLFYSLGKFDGKQSVYYTNGNLKNVYPYKNDIMEGEETGYYQTGKLKYKSMVAAGNYNGAYDMFYENGSPYKNINFVKGLKSGPAKEYFNYPKGATYAEGIYENDQPVGEWKYYYNTGKVFSTGAFNKKGLKDGVWKTYSNKGVLIKEDTYSDGRSEGIAKNYYDDGKIYEEFYYRKNKINLYKYYSTSGAIVKEISKQKNEFNFDLYNKNGTQRMAGKIIGDQLDGQITTYNYLGLKTEVKEYKDEKVVNKELNYYTNGQVLSEMPYNDGMEDGLYTKYFVNGKTLTQGYYVNSNAEGYWFYYDKNGPLSEIRYYENGVQRGWQRTFACNGKLFRAEKLESNRIVERCYYDTLGNVLKRISYDACDNCEVIIPSIDGNTWIKRKLKNNYINGMSVTYFPDGTPNFESTYDMDLEIGVSKNYTIFGKVQAETTYDYDNKQGPYTLYKDGKVDYTANYVNNQLSGETKDYYENGKIYQLTNYEFNDAEGPSTIYDELGNVAVVLNYVEDNLVSYTYENETGKLITPIEVNTPNMAVKAFYKNKKPSLSYTIKNGQKEGVYVLYSSTGTKLIEATYSNGYLNGLRTEYYGNGKVKSKCNFSYGEFNGVYSEYYETGTIKTELAYMIGSRHGLSKYYDATGKLLVKCLYYDDNPVKIIK